MRQLVLLAWLLTILGCNRSGSLVRPANKATSLSDEQSQLKASPAATPSPISGDPRLVDLDTAPNGSEQPNTPTGSAQEDKVEFISFDDLNLGMPEDARFRQMMLNFNDGRTKELLGKVINVGGQMNPPDQLTGLTEFVLLKNKNCKFGPGGQADHLARVFMKDGMTVDYTDQVIYVEGRITLNIYPQDSPMTWSIYDIEATKVSTRRPRQN